MFVSIAHLPMLIRLFSGSTDTAFTEMASPTPAPAPAPTPAFDVSTGCINSLLTLPPARPVCSFKRVLVEREMYGPVPYTTFALNASATVVPTIGYDIYTDDITSYEQDFVEIAVPPSPPLSLDLPPHIVLPVVTFRLPNGRAYGPVQFEVFASNNSITTVPAPIAPAPAPIAPAPAPLQVTVEPPLISIEEITHLLWVFVLIAFTFGPSLLLDRELMLHAFPVEFDTPLEELEPESGSGATLASDVSTTIVGSPVSDTTAFAPAVYSVSLFDELSAIGSGDLSSFARKPSTMKRKPRPQKFETPTRTGALSGRQQLLGI